MMNRFFVLSTGLAMCAVASLAQADKPSLQSLDTGIRVHPVRVGQLGPDGRLIGGWIPAEGGVAGQHCSEQVIFDCFESDAEGWPINGTECGIANGNRWFFGESYCNMFAVNDMTVGEGTGAFSDRVGIAWMWYVNGVGTSEDCYVIVETYEDFDDTCSGPPADNWLTGVIIGFGTLDSGAGAGYYFSDVDLCDFGLGFDMPVTGSGAYTIILANAYDTGTGDITLATCGQPMLWGTGDGENPDDGRIGSQGGVQWDDDNPSDGTHTAPDECYDYYLGVCPDPLGAMVKFWGEGGSAACMTLDIGPLFGGSPGTFTVTDAAPNTLVAIIYSMRGCTGEMVDRGPLQDSGGREWCLSLGLNIALQDMEAQQVCAGRTNASGTYQCQKPIPGSASGRTVGFQAFTQGTCPDYCGSDCIEVRIQ